MCMEVKPFIIMEEEYEDEKTIVMLTRKEAIRILNGKFVKGSLRIKKIGMVVEE